MADASVRVSGLSQQVICGGVPYAIEITRVRGRPDWTVKVIDTQARATILSQSAANDAQGFLDAMQHIDRL